MVYVQRSLDGHLLRVERQPFEGMTETLELESEELHAWLNREEVRSRLNKLKDSDLELIRVLEDLVGVLVEQGVIRYTDLPEAAQRKLQDRAQARAGLGGLSNLLGDEDEQHLI
ncbi:tryptophan synthase subunit beta [Pseudomonas sp. MAP12]|uniref:Tryptophan synthase subunit beta n=1 Tax=Geopseudomonas aromaticivorans TaxID=2849492 RepID=A0ABS6MRH2_9GAMM|nr:tryptophan synthase subunit beta [Pseudomonas aromaticivorans]MBV2131403.1 tryptophan synthase subunit beta [Pseudomonas aromaticivorans]